ncbi:MAG: hypothetical protein U1E26_08200 [Coriobacteriia bacterium]|nr:hypothetical protein [Coriobacteriia bacterium]
MDENHYDLDPETVEPPAPSGLDVIDTFEHEPESMPEMPPEGFFPVEGVTEPPESSDLPVIDGFVNDPEPIPEAPETPTALDEAPPAVDVSDLVPESADTPVEVPTVPADYEDPFQQMEEINRPPETAEPPAPSGLDVIDTFEHEPESMPEMPPEGFFPVEGVTEPPQSSDLPVIDGFVNDLQPIPEAPETPETAELPDASGLDDCASDPEIRPDITAAPELQEIMEPPIVAYEQGINDFEFQGTCGPTTISNSLNSLFGGSEYSENGCLTVAVDNGLCSVTGDPAACGGTTTEQLVELYREIEPERIDVGCFDFENALTEQQIAERLESGSVINIAVDSKTLWGEDYGFDAFTDQVFTDHWIQVNGVERSDTGDITGFSIVDSGGGVDHVDATQFHAMYIGTPDRTIADPTCIVVSRKP